MEKYFFEEFKKLTEPSQHWWVRTLALNYLSTKDSKYKDAVKECIQILLEKPQNGFIALLRSPKPLH